MATYVEENPLRRDWDLTRVANFGTDPDFQTQTPETVGVPEPERIMPLETQPPVAVPKEEIPPPPEGFVPLVEEQPKTEEIPPPPEGFIPFEEKPEKEKTPELVKKEAEKPAVDELGFWDKMKRRWSIGREQAADDQLAYRASTGELRWEDVKDQLEPSLDRKTAEGKAWYSEGLLQSAEMLPAMIDSMVSASKQAAGWGTAAAGAALVGGQLGPQAAFPEELITVPGAAIAGYGAGEVYGSIEYWRKQGAGNLYNELRKEGVGHGTAQAVSNGFAIPYAAIEFAQVSKLVPGMKQSVAHTIAGKVKERLIALGKEKAIEYGEQIGQETAQEVLQAGSEGVAEWMDSVKPPPGKQGFWDRIRNTVVQTAESMPFLMGPKAAVDVTGVVATGDTTPAAAPAQAAQPPPQAAVPPGAVPPVVPPVTPSVGAAPGVTITPAPGEVPTPPDLAAPPVAGIPPVTPPGVPPVTPEAAPPGVPPVTPSVAAVPGEPAVTPTTPVPEGHVELDGVGEGKVTLSPDAQNKLNVALTEGTPEAVQSFNDAFVNENPQHRAVSPEQATVLAQQMDESFAEPAASQPNIAPASRLQAINAQLATTTDPAQRQELEKEKVLIETKQTAQGQVAEVKAQAQNLAANNAPETAKALVEATAKQVGETAVSVQEHLDEITPAGVFAEEEGAAPPAAQPAVPGEAAPPTVPPPAAQAQAQGVQPGLPGIEPGVQPAAEAEEQVVRTGVKGQEAVKARPSAQLAQQLAGVAVEVPTISEEGEAGVAQNRDAASALSELKDDLTGFQVLINCLS